MSYPAHKSYDSTRNNNSIIYTKYNFKKISNIPQVLYLLPYCVLG